MIPTLNLNMNGYQPYGPIPKVASTADAIKYPSQLGNEDVLFDTNDPEIAYFRSTDVNGVVSVDRRRCIPEPEPTIQEMADQRYVSKDDFKEFLATFNDFRKEISDNVRKLAETGTGIATFTANDTSNVQSAVNDASTGRVQKQVIHAAKRPKSESTDAADDGK